MPVNYFFPFNPSFGTLKFGIYDTVTKVILALYGITGTGTQELLALQDCTPEGLPVLPRIVCEAWLSLPYIVPLHHPRYLAISRGALRNSWESLPLLSAVRSNSSRQWQLLPMSAPLAKTQAGVWPFACIVCMVLTHGSAR